MNVIMDFIEILERTYKLVEFVETNFSQQLKKRKTDQKYEIDFNFLSMNSEKKYIGAFFESKNNNDLTLWAGYDVAFGHFCISFCSSQQEIVKQVLECFQFSYSAEYIAIDKYYWYSIFVDVPYKTNADKNRESKVSDNEIDYSSLKKDIADILKKIDAEIKKKQGTENV